MAKCAVCGKTVYFGVVVEKECLDALRRGARTGRWEYVDGDEYSETFRCKCGHEVRICIEIICEALPNYCPACGCDMRKKPKGEVNSEKI